MKRKQRMKLKNNLQSDEPLQGNDEIVQTELY